MRHRGPSGHARSPAFLYPRIKASDKRRDFRLCRPRFLFGRHLAGIHLLQHLRPMMRVRTELEIPRKPVDPEITLFFFRPVTAEAMLGQEGFK
jgi:hypothetical protein